MLKYTLQGKFRDLVWFTYYSKGKISSSTFDSADVEQRKNLADTAEWCAEASRSLAISLGNAHGYRLLGYLYRSEAVWQRIFQQLRVCASSDASKDQKPVSRGDIREARKLATLGWDVYNELAAEYCEQSYCELAGLPCLLDRIWRSSLWYTKQIESINGSSLRHARESRLIRGQKPYELWYYEAGSVIEHWPIHRDQILDILEGERGYSG